MPHTSSQRNTIRAADSGRPRVALLFLRIWAAILLPLCIAGCIISSSSDGDGGGEKKSDSPEILSFSIAEGAVVDSADVMITWTASGSPSLYTYTLDGVRYPPVDTTMAVFRGLDESEHVFSVKAIRDTLESETASVTFTVDAITGPGILFMPRMVRSLSFTTIYLENVQDLMAAHIELVSPGGEAILSEFVTAETPQGETAPIVIVDQTDTRRLVIDVGFPGRPAGVSGRLALGSFLVRPLKDNGAVVVDSLSTVFRDTENTRIDIQDLDYLRIQR